MKKIKFNHPALSSPVTFKAWGQDGVMLVGQMHVHFELSCEEDLEEVSYIRLRDKTCLSLPEKFQTIWSDDFSVSERLELIKDRTLHIPG